jgi:serralysin
MSISTAAAGRPLDLNQSAEALAVQAIRLSDSAQLQVAGSDLDQKAVTAMLGQQDVSSAFGLTSAGADGDIVLRCGCPGCLKGGKGADTDTQAAPGPLAADDIPDDTSSTVVLDVHPGETVTTQLDHPGDHDYFQVNLQAGVVYEFTIDPTTNGETAVDPLINIYDADGNFVTQYDTESNGGTEDFDFMSESGGLYYIDVGAYNDASMGGYSITGGVDRKDPDPYAGTPLDAIDWGTRVNTDGVVNNQGDEVIHVYFAKQGEVTPHPITETNVNSGWQDFEKAAAFRSFQLYENVINVDFVEVNSQAEADFIFGISPSAPALLGAMSPPGESTEGAAWFNNAGVGWDQQGLAQGGFGFITFTHELGHGMGMAHPHDNGGDSMIMHGVESDTDSGDFGMNQGVHTVMTYNDGWPDGPFGKSPSDNYGFQGTLMALDLKVLQDKYGANMEYKTGDDVYVLPSANDTGQAGGDAATMYACIWDAGGRDKISAGAARDVNIDLREATLKYEVGGGGWVSYGYDANGDPVHGGFTIANGVRIEDAEGGVGDDRLVGNRFRNELDGGEGKDRFLAGRGNDVVDGGAGRDFLEASEGDDRLIGGEGRDLLSGGIGADKFVFFSGDLSGDRINDLEASDTIDLSRIDANSLLRGNQAFTFVDEFSRTAGEARLTYDSVKDLTRLALDTDGNGRADMNLYMDGDQTSFGGFIA